jgi:hypothetical protein
MDFSPLDKHIEEDENKPLPRRWGLLVAKGEVKN